MTERYLVVSTRDNPSTLDSSALADVLANDGQLLLPMLDLIENAECAVDDLIDVMGRATIEAVLLMSAAGVAGPKQQGKKADRDVVYHGSQKGRVPLKERELRVDKPRLRRKHVLGLREGAAENAVAASASSADLVARGLDPKRRRLFVIDGSKAVWKAIDEVFGDGTPVQRRRNHKLRNVLGHLPEEQHDRARSTFKAAFKLDMKEGTAKIEQYATWSEREWTGAAGSLREGLDEMFTINRLGPPSELRRCLGTTNIIDNGHSALRDRVRRVKNWRSGSMALRWTAVAFDAIAQGFRRIMGYRHLWMLKAALDESSNDRSLAEQAKAG